MRFVSPGFWFDSEARVRVSLGGCQNGGNGGWLVKREERNALLGLPALLIVAAGLSWAGSRGGGSVVGIPVFALCVGLAFVVQWLAFVPAYVLQTERFFDITGSFTYISVAAVAVALGPGADARTLVLLGLISVWAIRLGLFLLRRVRKAGKDERFDSIKRSFPRFLLTWTLQGMWVSFTLAAALAAFSSSARRPFDGFAWAGLVIWLVGFGIEATADVQKSRFRSEASNRGRFIQSGLWAWSRHPNYFGEIVLWVGIAVIAAPVLRGWQFVTMISPVFVAVLLTRISGIPILERRADERWGKEPDYQAYTRRTSVLIPLPPRR